MSNADIVRNTGTNVFDAIDQVSSGGCLTTFDIADRVSHRLGVQVSESTVANYLGVRKARLEKTVTLEDDKLVVRYSNEPARGLKRGRPTKQETTFNRRRMDAIYLLDTIRRGYIYGHYGQPRRLSSYKDFSPVIARGISLALDVASETKETGSDWKRWRQLHWVKRAERLSEPGVTKFTLANAVIVAKLYLKGDRPWQTSKAPS